MGYSNNRMDSCLDGCGATGCRGGRGGLTWIVMLAVALMTWAGPALGQFNVQPMKIDLQVRPGKLIKSVLNIQSLDPNETHTIDLSLVDLTQDQESAAWKIIEPNTEIDRSTLSSCKDQLTLDPTSVTIGPLQTVPVEVTLRVPRGKRGFACAGIVAAIRSREDATDVSFVLRFMVPLLMEIQGRPVPNKVQATDLSMRFREANSAGPATTLLSMTVENTGESFPRCRPVARIWSWAGGHWRVITTTAFQDKSFDVGIIPGATIEITTNLMKSLPPGRYKVAGVLYVDTKRTPRVEKIIDFAGDPSITRVAVDTPLDLIPGGLTIDSIPGATRTTVLRVHNGSDETVNIKAVMALPRDLGAKGMGTVRGADMDCTPWTRIEPEQFTLRGEGAAQTVRVTTMMPESATNLPCYYSNLDFWAFYPDGQNAGVTTAKICVQNQKATSDPSAIATKMTPHAFASSKYQIVATFSNNGIIHFEPGRCKAAVIPVGETTGIARASARLTSVATGVMLPFEERSFSGVLDFTTLDAGAYRLSVALEYAPDKWAEKQSAIEVTVEGDQRIIRTTGIQEELPGLIKVKWSKAPANAILGDERG